MSRKTRLLTKKVFPFIVLTLVLAACSSSSRPSSNPSDPSGLAASPAPSLSSNNTSKPFVVSTVIEVDTVDIDKSTWVDIANSLIYEPLLNYDDKGKIVAGLAESYSVSADGKVWTFHLKKNVKFHSGEPLTADAMKTSIDRFMTMSPVKDIAGPVDKIEVTDPLTVQVYFKEPYAPFISVATSPFLGPIDPKRVAELGDKFENNPSSVGPFMFQKHDKGSSISYKKNPDYNWGPPLLKNQGAPYIDELTFKFTKDDDTRVLEFKKGDVQMLNGVPNSYVKDLQNIPNVEFIKALEPGEKYLGFNLQRPQFQDVRVRKALAMAIDREPFVEVALSGYGQSTFSPLPTTIFGHSDKVENDAKNMYARDVDKAKALLAEAGWKDTNGDGIADKNGKPLSIELVLPHNPILERSAQILQTQFKEIGADLKLSINELAAVKDKLAVGKSDFDMFMMYYDYTDPDVLYLLFDPNTNRMRYTNPKLTDLLQQGRSTMDQTARAKVYKDAQEILIEDLPIIPLFSEETIIATRDVEGVIYNPFSTSFYLNDVKWKK
ncbi:ABC transporter substrate-binding protein [Paenibacillus aestuarii]|uniref:ABC transporter substrate-binding protein n=1 Tax=Paenibacillus aestuarii TaxID=516965 RepID=A0ABW0K994_9BACL|nr:ABC transporter substrate-binding protein [Paenibacillus aestuarii]